MNTELREKERIAMERLKAFEAEDGYFLAYSGGKDSDCIKILAQLAGVKFETVHNLTTVDAPETVRYIKSQPDVRISRSYDRDGKPVTMWNLIVRKGTPPLRTSRYCCSELKEPGGTGKTVVTGVRWAESTRRKQTADVVKFIGKPKGTQKIAEELGADYRTTRQGGIVLNDDNDINRRMVEHCYRTRKTMVNPIADWTDEDVWEFLNHYGCKSNPLYECGFKRIGCIQSAFRMDTDKKESSELASLMLTKDFFKKIIVRMDALFNLRILLYLINTIFSITGRDWIIKAFN